MKRGILILIPAVLLMVGGVWLWRFAMSNGETAAGTQPAQATMAASTVTIVPSQLPAGGPGQPVPLLGESILRDYGNTNLPPENDLVLLSRLMANSVMLLKSAAHRPLSANEDWADMWRGRNAISERFLPDQHAALNSQGQLVDRWGTPLFFHSLGAGRYEIRTAGPDKALWTDDDIHRNSDGSLRRGGDLNPASLFENGPGRSGQAPPNLGRI